MPLVQHVHKGHHFVCHCRLAQLSSPHPRPIPEVWASQIHVTIQHFLTPAFCKRVIFVVLCTQLLHGTLGCILIALVGSTATSILRWGCQRNAALWRGENEYVRSIAARVPLGSDECWWLGWCPAYQAAAVTLLATDSMLTHLHHHQLLICSLTL